jgi:putative copper export protein/methionine-rich copper-binding protein CopC
LVKSTPANGVTLDKLPDYALLEFTEELGPEDLTVKTGATRLKVAAVTVKPTTLKVDLRSVKSAKTVLLSWRAEDPHDGHESSGVITLHVKTLAAATASSDANANAPPKDSRLITWVTVSARIVGYLAMAVFVGGLLFVSLLWPAGASERRTRRLLVLSVAAGIAAAAASEAVVVWRSSGSLTLREALNQDFGRITTATALLWLLAAVVVAAVLQRGTDVVRGDAWRVGAVIVAAGLIRTTGMNAHATQGPEPTWGAAAEFLHLMGISAWIGGLTIMSVCLLPRRRIAELEQVVPKFSTIALGSVLVIVTSGLILSWQIISSVDDFWQTHYSRVLLLKLALFVTVLLAAMKSKNWVGRHLATTSHREPAVGSFVASVATETVLAFAVLGAASVLVTSSPGV